MSLISQPPDFPPEGFTLYDDILDADEVFDDGTYSPLTRDLFGFPVVLDETMPPNRIEIRDNGRLLGVIRFDGFNMGDDEI